MRWWSLVVLLVVARPVFAKELVPLGDISLEAKGTLERATFCAKTRFLAATITEGTTRTGALYQIDVAAKRATRIGALPAGHELVFNADCSLLAIGASTALDETRRRHEVQVYKTASTGTVQHASLGTLAAPVTTLAFVDDTTLLVGMNQGPLQLWSLTKTPSMLDQRELKGSVLCVASAPGLVAAGFAEGGVVLLPLANNKLGAPTTLVANGPDTRKPGAADSETGAFVMPGGGRVHEVAFSDKGIRLLAMQEQGNVLSWSIAKGATRTPSTIAQKLANPSALAVSTDDRLVVVGDDLRVSVWQNMPLFRVVDIGKIDRADKHAAVTALAFVGPRELLVGSQRAASVTLYRVK